MTGTTHQERRTAADLTRAEIEDFLYHEAAILEAWQWDDWLALFEEGARYEVPTFDGQRWSGREAQYFIADDWDLLQARRDPDQEQERPRREPAVAHEPADRQRPPPRHRDGHPRRGGQLRGAPDARRPARPLRGQYRHELVLVGGDLRFRVRRAVLLTESVRPGTRLSFIL